MSIWQAEAGILNSALQETVYTIKKYPSKNVSCALLRNAGSLWLSNFFDQYPWSHNPINTHF